MGTLDRRFIKGEPTADRDVPDAIIRICEPMPDFGGSFVASEEALEAEAEALENMLMSLPQGVREYLAQRFIKSMWPVSKMWMLVALLGRMPARTLELLILELLRSSVRPEDALDMLEAVKEKVNEAWSGEDWSRPCA